MSDLLVGGSLLLGDSSSDSLGFGDGDFVSSGGVGLERSSRLDLSNVGMSAIERGEGMGVD